MSKLSSKEDLTEFVKRAKAGDEDALKELIIRTQVELLRFLTFLCGNRQLAQDLLQDSYIKALENLKKLQDPKAFRSWLLRLAKNLFLDHVRSPKNSAHQELDEIQELAANGNNAEILVELESILSSLSPEERYGMLLVYLEDYSYAEAATELGISENALRSRLHRSRNKLASGE